MKKIKLGVNVLKLKREEISNLTNGEMKQVIGGYGTGPCTTGGCVTDACGTTEWQCTTTLGSTHGSNCPTPTPSPSEACTMFPGCPGPTTVPS